MQSQSLPFISSTNTHALSIYQMTEVDPEIRRFKLSLMSGEEQPDGTIIYYDEPILNDKGVRSVMGQIDSIVHRITIMSNLSNEEISKEMISSSRTLILDLMFNRVNYGIKNSISDRTKIVSMFQSLVFSCIKRSMSGDDKRFWKGVHTENVNSISNMAQQSQPWYKRWGLFK